MMVVASSLVLKDVQYRLAVMKNGYSLSGSESKFFIKQVVVVCHVQAEELENSQARLLSSVGV